ncbi:MAG TPA: hypothetical protein OIL90_09750 [Phascolarctobacterium faecium]|uniref:hypothetical protein n=1 Tax=Phascolarctobacterium faecium TaxID=33025 RepID=UPI0024330ECA|nr:hypothetical protein [Phascolarctobacterium faecium]HJI10388.1 hypothetical protein [Phascolarctobacterium faecium]
MSIKEFLNQIPNAVSGDGKTFVAKLKKFLEKFEKETDEKLDNMSVGGAEQLIGLSLMETHSTDANGMPQNNIVVEFDTTNVTNFSTAQIWVSSDSGKTFQQVGTTGGLRYIIEKVTAGITYIVKVVAVNTSGGSSDKDRAPQASITIKGSVLIPDMPKQFVLTWDEEGPLWEWLHEDNGYVDFFELRLDGNTGVYSDKLLDRTRDFKSRANPKIRSGTAYLFVRNIFGTYSSPAIHQFGKPLGSKPDRPVLSALLSGVNIKMQSLPVEYKGYKLIINGDDFTSKNNEFVYFIFSGKITVKYCFVDDIGDGEYSEEVTADVKLLVETSDIDDEAITGGKIAANAVTAAKIQANAVTANKIAADAITADKIAADAITAEKIAADAVRAEAIQAGSIIGEHISAGAVTAEKLAAETITLGGELKVVGGAVTLSGDGLKVAEADGCYTLFDQRGITFYDENAKAYAMVKKQIMGTAMDGQRVMFANPWKEVPKVVCTPIDLPSYVFTYDGFNTLIQCYAYDIDNTGFNVRCRSVVAAGTTGGEVPLNYTLNLNDATLKYDGHPTKSYSIPFAVPANANITVTGTMTASGANFIQRYWVELGGGYWREARVYRSVKCYAQLIVDGSVVATTTELYGYRAEGKINFALTANNIQANAGVSIRFVGWYTEYIFDGYSQPHIVSGAVAPAICEISTIKSSVAIESVASTGTASFIATDNNNAGYTVT